MKLFECQKCHNAIHFENSACVACGSRLGYAPDEQKMIAVEAMDGPASERPVFNAASGNGRRYFFCANADQGVCNWLVPVEDRRAMCLSCCHNRIAPDLTVDGNIRRWSLIEKAKRHLFYSLLLWELPTPTLADNVREPLVFDLIGDVLTGQGVLKVLTGHESGVITLNIAEADDDEREKRRIAMGEPYRTLLGHFRHEIGHYYWDLLVRDEQRLQEFRAIFGDESADYAMALQSHYAIGAPPGWPASFISAYATSHPWEDFAETWAHYMHIVDTLETAHSLGISLKPRHSANENLEIAVRFDAYRSNDVDEILAAWTPVSVAINSLNRSLGEADAYPFVLSHAIVEKLGFIHRLVRDQRAATVDAAAE
jgi:hypothetical protein